MTTSSCQQPRQGELQTQAQPVREVRYTISRHRGQASTKVRYIETSTMH